MGDVRDEEEDSSYEPTIGCSVHTLVYGSSSSSKSSSSPYFVELVDVGGM